MSKMPSLLGFVEPSEDYVPRRLPCGKRINDHYYDRKHPLYRQMQCCRTECSDKTPQEIDECYDLHKYGAVRFQVRRREEYDE